MSALLSFALPSFPGRRTPARHARPSRLAPVLAAGGLTVAFAVTDGLALTSAASAGGSQAQFERLAQCESGGNWSINTGNGYYGGLQFHPGTWRGLGFGGLPHEASKATQIAAGQKLHSQRGWSPWPACSRKLGLRGDGGDSSDGSSVAPERRDADTASRSRAAAPRPVASRALVATAAPRFSGRVFTLADRRTYRADVRQWQARMAARGYRIAADGYFGPKSSAVARRFVQGTGLTTGPGTVDAQLFARAWTSPV